ncbi:MAG TPA: thioesterase family protein [Vicinamibacterales bacterium]|nr:thioesterase family protein [Vicinamibacterales bacterium]
MTGEILIRYRLLVRFSDCDPLGHVNNATYLTYLEQPRIILWGAQLGFSSRRPAGDRRGEGFILARCEINFRAQAHDGDRLEVRLALTGFGRSTATYEYEIVDLADGHLVVSARTVQVWFDYDASRSVPITEELKGTLSRSPWKDAGGLFDESKRPPASF